MVGELCLDRLLVIILATKEICMNFTLSCKCNAGPVVNLLCIDQGGKNACALGQGLHMQQQKRLYTLFQKQGLRLGLGCCLNYWISVC